jgi:hypothetical protein
VKQKGRPAQHTFESCIGHPWISRRALLILPWAKISRVGLPGTKNMGNKKLFRGKQPKELFIVVIWLI